MERNSSAALTRIEKKETIRLELERQFRPFVEKSLSAETRRAYGRVVKEFFRFHELVRPEEVTPADVIRWRDTLVAKKKAASTVAFKLSVIRSLFEYLKAGVFVKNNPALAKLVTPPKVSENLRGRALTVKEVSYILSSPDREKPEGARD